MKLGIGLLILLTGCGNAEFTRYEKKAEQPLEETVTKGLEVIATASPSCKDEKLAIVQKNKPIIQNLVTHIKNLVGGNTPVLNMKTMKSYVDQPSDDQIDLIFQILASDGFRTVVSQSSDVIKTVALNDTIMTNLAAIRDDLLSEPGDRTAEIITTLASDPIQQSTFLGAARTALCDNPSEQDLLGTLLTPKVLWSLGPNGMYLLGSPLYQHAKPLLLAIRQLPIPDELSQFIDLVKQMLPKPNICTLDNLDAYQPHLALVLSLLKPQDNAADPRPLRSFINVVFKLYSMESSNQCSGTSFDDLKKETVQRAFLTVSNFMADDQHGVIGFLKQMKPRR